jgi:hypothetical protein
MIADDGVKRALHFMGRNQGASFYINDKMGYLGTSD